MQQRLDGEWALAISPDTVRLLVDKAKAVSAGINEDYEDGAEHEVELGEDGRDRHRHDGLAEEEEDNLTETELRALLADLNVDEAADLVALMWIGRGDYEAAEFAQAAEEARRRDFRRIADYLLSQPTLGDWLEDGLDAIGA